LESALQVLMPRDVRIHGDDVTRLPNTVNAAFPRVSGETLVIALDLAGFARSYGLGVRIGRRHPFARRFGPWAYSEDDARGAVRFSLDGYDRRRDRSLAPGAAGASISRRDSVLEPLARGSITITDRSSHRAASKALLPERSDTAGNYWARER
jgi:cysteine desulfurase